MRLFHYGERLRVETKLYPPRNYRNPGAFDYGVTDAGGDSNTLSLSYISAALAKIPALVAGSRYSRNRGNCALAGRLSCSGCAGRDARFVRNPAQRYDPSLSAFFHPEVCMACQHRPDRFGNERFLDWSIACSRSS